MPLLCLCGLFEQRVEECGPLDRAPPAAGVADQAVPRGCGRHVHAHLPAELDLQLQLVRHQCARVALARRDGLGVEAKQLQHCAIEARRVCQLGERSSKHSRGGLATANSSARHTGATHLPPWRRPTPSLPAWRAARTSARGCRQRWPRRCLRQSPLAWRARRRTSRRPRRHPRAPPPAKPRGTAWMSGATAVCVYKQRAGCGERDEREGGSRAKSARARGCGGVSAQRLRRAQVTRMSALPRRAWRSPRACVRAPLRAARCAAAPSRRPHLHLVMKGDAQLARVDVFGFDVLHQAPPQARREGAREVLHVRQRVREGRSRPRGATARHGTVGQAAGGASLPARRARAPPPPLRTPSPLPPAAALGRAGASPTPLALRRVRPTWKTPSVHSAAGLPSARPNVRLVAGSGGPMVVAARRAGAPPEGRGRARARARRPWRDRPARAARARAAAAARMPSSLCRRKAQM